MKLPEKGEEFIKFDNKSRSFQIGDVVVIQKTNVSRSYTILYYKNKRNGRTGSISKDRFFTMYKRYNKLEKKISKNYNI